MTCILVGYLGLYPPLLLGADFIKANYSASKFPENGISIHNTIHSLFTNELAHLVIPPKKY